MIPEKNPLLHRNPGLLHFLVFLYKTQFSDTVGGARRCQTARILQIARAHPQATDEQLGQIDSPECRLHRPQGKFEDGDDVICPLKPADSQKKINLYNNSSY